MLQRIFSGFMALLMSLSPAHSGNAETTDPDAPEPIRVEAQAQSDAPEPPAFTPETVRSVTFSDSPEDAADAISYVAYFGLMSGYDGGAFRPDAFLTVGQAMRILRRVAVHLGLDGGDENASDFDWASQSGLLSAERQDGPDAAFSYDGAEILIAYPDGSSVAVSMRPDSDLTRAKLAFLLYRFASVAGCNLDCSGNLSLRPDADIVPQYARLPYSWTMEHGIFRTIVEDGLCPNLPVSRAQAAMIFTALLADASGEPVATEITEAAQKPFFTSKSRDFHDAIQEAVDAAGRRYGATGLQVAVIERGRLSDTYAYGWATKSSDPMTALHKMRIASISKVLIGMTAARMRQDGLIAYWEPLGTYWDASFVNPAHPNSPITIQTLLTHTSSLADGGLNASNVRNRLASGRGYTSAYPGALENWEYSNYGFGVLGLTLERVGNRTMDQLLNQYFFDLMGVDASFYAGDLRDPSQIATLYSGGAVTRSITSQLSRHNPGVCKDGSVFAGGLVISARDLGKMAALLANDGVYEGLRVLSPDAVQLMETYENQTVSDGFYQAMPLRYRTNAYGRKGIYYHTGSAYGVFNGFSYDPETGDGVVVLTVGASGARDTNGNYAICGAIFDAVYHAIAS